jgi:small multidrug resistance pump
MALYCMGNNVITVLYLLLAIVFEVAGTTSMKLSEGFTQIIPSIFIFVFYAFSFVFLTFTLKRLELSLAYAVWAGLGTSLIAIIGVIFFHEPMTIIKGLSLLLVILGVIGLELA